MARRLRPAEKWFRGLPAVLQDEIMHAYILGVIHQLVSNPKMFRELLERMKDDGGT